MQNQQQQHNMILENKHETGAEEWHCAECGRKFIMQWSPTYKKIVLEVGDEYASHSGTKGNLRFQQANVAQTQAEEQILSDELRELIDDALQHIDFSNFES